MELILLGFFFCLFCATAVPLAFSIGLSVVLFFILSGKYSLTVVAQSIVSVNESFTLLALPFFILAGELMTVGGIGKRITNFASILVGWIPGGLAAISVVASMFFGGMSGSAAADAACIGGIMIPAMKRKNYSASYASAVIASAGTIGVIIPPSIPMVLYAFVSGVSLGDLFLGGFIPGALVGISLIIVAVWIALKNGYPTEPFGKPKEIFKVFIECIPALMAPVIILGGIFAGIVTPTEAAVIAVIYALFVGFVIYRELKISDLPRIFINTAELTAIIMLIIGTGDALGWALTVENFPTIVSNAIINFTNNKYVLLFLINIFLLLLGGPMPLAPSLLLTAPILLPVVTKFGVDPLHFGLIMVCNLAIGIASPPVGNTLFIAAKLADVPVERTSIALIPFLLVNTLVLMLITYFPPASLWLPNLIKG
jgi:C4-dicarboxylate transporter DctM subunit